YREQGPGRIHHLRPQQGAAHRDATGIAKMRVIAENRILGRVANRAGLRKAALEAIWPGRTGGPHRLNDEILTSEGKHHIELGAAFDQSLRKQDVGPAGKRTEAAADHLYRESVANGGGDLAFVVSAKTRADHMARVGDHHRRAKRLEQRYFDIE